MGQVSQFLKDISKHSDTVKKCTRALKHLGVTRFYYAFINEKGEHVLLSDAPDTVEYYYEQSLYYKDPYMRHPDNYKSGFFAIEHFKKNEFDESLARVGQKFKQVPIIGLCEKHEESVEFFRFWGEYGAVNFDMSNLQYANLLKAFARHFKEECSQIIKPYDAQGFSVKELVGANLFENAAKTSSKIDAKALRSYLQEIGLGADVARADALTPREKMCMRLLLKGKSMKEMASLLLLSPRTVEHYLESIKNKFCCRYKNELFVIAERLYEFGLIT